MKVNKKAVLSTAAVLGVAALIAGGTIAYFTDYEHQENRFSVGSVDIKLYESQLHRQNSGRAATFAGLTSDPNYCDWTTNPNTYFGDSSLIKTYDGARYCTPGTTEDIYSDDASEISAIANGHTDMTRRYWGITDGAIIDDAENSFATYFNAAASDTVPGQWIRKFAYVENQGDSEAYVLISYTIPTELVDAVWVKVPGTPYEETTATGEPYFYALTKDANNHYVKYTGNIDDYAGYTYDAIDASTGETVNYTTYAAVTSAALLPGEMTFWSPVNAIQIKNTAIQDDFENYDTFDIDVDAAAIQAFTFADAIEAANQL